MFSRTLGVLLCALIVGACGATQEGSVDEFSGAEREVAQLIADLGTAASDADAAQICSAVLTRQLADRIKAGSRTCTQELEDAITDADEFTLDTQDIAVAGTRATARVTDGGGRSRVVEVVRQGSDWRIAGIRAA